MPDPQNPSASVGEYMSDFYEAAHNSRNVPKALAEVQRNWLVKLRTEKGLPKQSTLPGHSL
jgi:hypothetical protein